MLDSSRKRAEVYIIPVFYNSDYAVRDILQSGNISVWGEKLIDLGPEMAVYSVLFPGLNRY